MTFLIERHETATHYFSQKIEAEDPDQAQELFDAWLDGGGKPTVSKVTDASTYITPVWPTKRAGAAETIASKG